MNVFESCKLNILIRTILTFVCIYIYTNVFSRIYWHTYVRVFVCWCLCVCVLAYLYSFTYAFVLPSTFWIILDGGGVERGSRFSSLWPHQKVSRGAHSDVQLKRRVTCFQHLCQFAHSHCMVHMTRTQTTCMRVWCTRVYAQKNIRVHAQNGRYAQGIYGWGTVLYMCGTVKLHTITRTYHQLHCLSGFYRFAPQIWPRRREGKWHIAKTTKIAPKSESACVCEVCS